MMHPTEKPDRPERHCPCADLTTWTENLAVYNQNVELAVELYNQLNHRLKECEIRLARYEEMMDKIVNKN